MCFPSLPDTHHAPSMKALTAVQKRAGTASPIAINQQRYSATSGNNPASSNPVHLSRTSPQQQYSHYVASFQQPPSRYSPPQPLALSPLAVPASSIAIRPSASPASTFYPCAQSPVLMSPRTPLSVNPNMSSPHTTHPSPRTGAAFRGPTPPSFQVHFCQDIIFPSDLFSS